MELDGGQTLDGINILGGNLGPAATLQSWILGLMNGGGSEEMAALLPRFCFRHWHCEVLAKMLRACRCLPAGPPPSFWDGCPSLIFPEIAQPITFLLDRVYL